MKTLNKNGFTLIELLISMAISGIVMVSIYRTFDSQQKSYVIQEDVAAMQQTIRSALLFMSNDIRMAGYDKQLTDSFGITDIRPRDVDNAVDAGITGHSCLEMTADLDDDGTIDTNETIQYSVYDFIATDGNLDMARNNGGGRQLLAENIQGFGLAFAFDDDLDGQMDTYTATNPGATQNTIWAIDSDGDNDLDTHLDTNLDGMIDVNDSPGGAGSNGIISGTALAADVNVDRIRAVKIWILVEANRVERDFTATPTHVVGKYVITPAYKKRTRLLTSTINCRNLGL